MRRRTFLQSVLGVLVAPWLPELNSELKAIDNYKGVELNIKEIGRVYWSAFGRLSNGQGKTAAGWFENDGGGVRLDLAFIPKFVRFFVEVREEIY